MSVFGIAMVRDEADIVEATVTDMLSQVDRVIVADNGSTDGTRELLDRLPCKVIDDPEVGYYQSRKMSALAARALAEGAEWVVPFDADEVWVPRWGCIADVLLSLPPDVLIAEATLYNHFATSKDPQGEPVARMGWRSTEPAPIPKVACRALPGLTIHQGNHGASFAGQPNPVIARDLLTIRHFPYRSADQFVSKVRNGAAAYAATDLPEGIGAHWRMYGELLDAEGPDAVRAWFREHFWYLDPESDPTLIFDPCQPSSSHIATAVLTEPAPLK